MQKFKSGFVLIIGKTNVGKSTLINMLVGEKIAAVVNKPQTTRTKIKAIVNRDNSQIVFIDSPGIHKPKNRFGNIMLETSLEAIKDADVVMFMVDSLDLKINEEEKIILDALKKEKKKVILLLNKIDKLQKEKLLDLMESYNKEYAFDAIIPISALKNKNIEDIFSELEKLLPEGTPYYLDDEYTDQTQRQLVEEIVREKSLQFLNDEVPHGIYVEVAKMKIAKTMKNESIFNIEAVIYCQRESHKGIIIGKNGAMLKRIGTSSRKELEQMLNTKINLKLWVKVDKDWQDKDSIIKKFKI